jgi:RNA polymerase sigma factor (sigma-70 family)
VVPTGARAPVDRETETRFRAGDRQAFLAVYTMYGSTIRDLVGRFFARPFEREEAVQEVWLLVHRMAPTFDPIRGALLPWLRTVAANRCKELLRAERRRLDPRAELDDEAIVAGAGDAAGPEDTVGAARLQAAVARFSARLSPEEAQIFRLSLVEERSHDEVARSVGISARRCKYLRMKLLLRVAADPAMRKALRQVQE